MAKAGILTLYKLHYFFLSVTLLTSNNTNGIDVLEVVFLRCATYADCRLQTGRLYIVLPIQIYTIYIYLYLYLYEALVWLAEVLV